MNIERPPLRRPTGAERDAATRLLINAVGDGRISLSEFGERTDALLRALDVADLNKALLDLGPERVPTDAAVVRRIVSVFGRHSRAGRWRLPDRLRVVTVLADTALDLRDAYCRGDTATIRAYGLFGDLRVFVPHGVDVDLTGAHIVGSRDQRTPGPMVTGMPRIRVRVTMLFGDVIVHALPVAPPR